MIIERTWKHVSGLSNVTSYVGVTISINTDIGKILKVSEKSNIDKMSLRMLKNYVDEMMQELAKTYRNNKVLVLNDLCILAINAISLEF